MPIHGVVQLSAVPDHMGACLKGPGSLGSCPKPWDDCVLPSCIPADEARQACGVFIMAPGRCLPAGSGGAQEDRGPSRAAESARCDCSHCWRAQVWQTLIAADSRLYSVRVGKVMGALWAGISSKHACSVSYSKHVCTHQAEPAGLQA